MDEEKINLSEEVEVKESSEESVIDLDSLREAYAAKKEEMKEKYKEAINAISDKHNVDVGVAFDMLEAVCRGGDYLDGIEVEVNKEELMRDYSEVIELSTKIADLLGIN